MILPILLSLLIPFTHASSVLDEDLKVKGVFVRPIPKEPEISTNCLCAKKYITKANAEDLEAMFSLANCYNSPEKVPTSISDTDKYCSMKPDIYSAWMGAAATRGFAPAQYAYGTAWFFGAGLPAASQPNAISWWAQAASQGLSVAFYSLGDAYEEGLGRKKDIKKALELFKEAKKLGDKRADKRIAKLEALQKK